MDPRLCLGVILRLLPRGVVLLAPVCSTMGTLARNHTRRCFIVPIGDVSRADVRSANVMSIRALVLCWVISALGGTFVLEQPAGGCFRHLPWFRYMAKYILTIYRQAVWMRAFGAPSLKRTFLWSNSSQVALLFRKVQAWGKKIGYSAPATQSNIACSVSPMLRSLVAR